LKLHFKRIKKAIHLYSFSVSLYPGRLASWTLTAA
jgi:hypothetical protein